MPPPSVTKVTKGIYRDNHRWYATVHVRGAGFREKRFPLAVTIKEVEAWRESERVKLLGTAERGSHSGSFRRDAERYLKDFTQHLASKASRKYEIDQWIKLFGTEPRSRITSADVARARSAWLTAKKSPKTINNRVNSLRHLYHCLDGKKAWTPCDDLTPLHVHKTPMQFVDDQTILNVDRTLQERETAGHIIGAKTRARFRVLVSTGRRPSEVMRTKPDDLDLKRRIWIPRDGKGGLSPGIYLNDDMLAAWKLFIAAKAWGEYDTYLHAERLRDAGWPTNIKPYQARHTVGITLSERGVDLDDIGPMMGHKRRETTRKHYVPVLNSRLQKASETLQGRFGGWPVANHLQNAAPQSSKTLNKNRQVNAAAKQATAGQKRRISSMKTGRKK